MMSTVERIAALFAGNETSHGTHGVPELDTNGVKWGIKNTAKTLKSAATPALWQQHIDGKRPLGVIPIRNDSTCVWGSIDIDSYDINLLEVVAKVESLKLPLVACRSKSGGLHLFLFASEPVPAASMQSALAAMAASLGFASSEIFPKQTKLDLKAVGNWIVMPYFGGTFDGKIKYQYGLKKTGAEMTLEEFVAFAEKRRVSAQKLGELATKSRGKGPSPKSGGGGVYSDGPPCLQKLAESGFPEGGRNNALFHIGVYLKKAHPSEWESKLESDNQKHMKPPLSDGEVKDVIRSLNKKDYEYKCKDQPMVSHCDSTLCCSRTHGVGEGTRIPVIVAWRKVMLEEPVHYVTIEGSNREMKILLFRDIYRHNLFVEHCGGQLNIIFPPIKQSIWTVVLRGYSKLMEETKPSADMTKYGHFKELLETFLTNRNRATSKEDILRGAPWHAEDEGRHYFRLTDLLRFLDRERMRVTRNEVTDWIRDLGGPENSVETTVKRTSIRLWFVPSEMVQESPDLDLPPTPKEPI